MVGLNPVGLGSFKEEEIRTETHTEGRQCKDGCLQVKERGLEQILPHGLRSNQPRLRLDLRLQASRILRQYRSIV